MKHSQKELFLKLESIANAALSQIDKEAKEKPELQRALKRAKMDFLFHERAELEGCINPSLLMKSLETRLDFLETDSPNFDAVITEEIRRAAIDPDTSLLFNHGTQDSTSLSENQKKPTMPNPWSKKSFNLTRQGQITKQNPALAQRLKEQAEN